MTTETIQSTIPPELMVELEEAADRAARGIRDPEKMKAACERMDQRREEIRRKFGVQEIGAKIIREMRGYPPEE